MSSYKRFHLSKISHVELLEYNMIATNVIQFYFVDDTDFLELLAVGDCCSSSWFFFLDNDLNLIAKDKTIDTIEISKEVKLPPSGVQEKDLNHLVTIKFTEGQHYDFILRNSSNGYYSGWIEINMKSFIAPPGNIWIQDKS